MVMRLLAFVAAVAMIVGALAFRNGQTGGTSDPGSSTTGDPSDAGTQKAEEELPEFEGTVALVCATELESVCRDLGSRSQGLDVRIEAAGDTEQRLAAAELADIGVTAWLAPTLSVDRVRSERSTSGLTPIITGTEPVASSPLVLAGRVDRIDALGSACAGSISWACLENLPDQWSNETWGPVKLGVPNPRQSGTGLVAVAHAGQTLAGGDPQQAARSYRSLDRLLREPTSANQLTSLITRVGSFDLVVALDGHATGAFLGTRDEENLATVPIEPVANVDIVLASLDPGAADAIASLLDPLRAAAVAAEWDPATGAGAALPDAISAGALRTVWTENTF